MNSTTLKVGSTVKYGMGLNEYKLLDSCQENWTKDKGCKNCHRVLNEFEVQEHVDKGHILYTWCSGHGPEIWG
jgi:hypothetical protein